VFVACDLPESCVGEEAPPHIVDVPVASLLSVATFSRPTDGNCARGYAGRLCASCAPGYVRSESQ